eukprot:gene17741-21155_t
MYKQLLSVLAVLAVSSAIVSSQPSYLYAFGGEPASTLTIVDLSNGISNTSTFNAGAIILGFLGATSDSALFLGDPNGNETFVSYSYAHGTFSQLGHIQGGINTDSRSQQYGYDVKTNKAYLVGVPANNQNLPSLFEWDFNAQMGSTLNLPITMAGQLPIGSYDPSTGIYYVLNYIGNNKGYNLIQFNTATGTIAKQSTFSTSVLYYPMVITWAGQVFFVDCPLQGPKFTLYQADLTKNKLKNVLELKTNFPHTVEQAPYTQIDNYVVFITTATKGNSITYTTFDLNTLKSTSIVSNEPLPEYSMYISAA